MPARTVERRRGIVLGTTKLAEQDLIVTLIDMEGEQVRAVAKGGRKPGARLAARTELFLDIDMLLSRGRGLPLITEAQIVDAHRGIRDGLERLSAASAIGELARLTCYENMRDPFLFALLARALHAVEHADDRKHLDVVVAAYGIKVLSHGGWRPELDACIACGEQPVSRISPAAGGVLCESCARDVAGAEPVDANGVAWIKALIGLTFDDLEALTVDQGSATFVLGFVHHWCATHLESRLRALEFYAGL